MKLNTPNMKLKITTILAVLTLFTTALRGQNKEFDWNPITNPKYQHIFDSDSLRGFDEEAVRRAAISDRILGAEFKVKMYFAKRNYIKDKYGLWPKQQQNYSSQARAAVTPGCVNEDFELSTAGAVTSTGQVNGWVITRGVHTGSSDACNLISCCPNTPTEAEVISAPTGIIDPNIGPGYPIYSVFGSNAIANPAPANAANPQVTQGMFGNTFLRLNSDLSNSSIEKLSKTFSVTASNALFQFAFINVFDGPHNCCEAGAFKVRILNASAGNSVVPCPNFTVFSSSPSCSITPLFTSYIGTVGTVYQPSINLAFNQCVYNKWDVNSLDLTSYIGQNITVEFTISDCIFGGHYTYCYFDAQCGPMVVYGNNQPYQAGSGNVTVPTCGAAGATICAAAGLGPYSWAGPNVPPSYAIPSFTNNCFVTNLSATYTLSMNPAGACVPITRIINSTITPAPSIFAGATQAICGQTLAVVNVTPSGSSTNPAALSWSPVPLSLNSTTTTGNYTLPVGPAPINVTIVATDNVGCKASATVDVLPAAPIPTFAFALKPTITSYSITCNNPAVEIDAISNYTYGPLNFFWASSSTTLSTNSASITTPGIFTVTGTDPNTFCSITNTIAVFMNTATPVAAISPTFQNITCNATSINQVTLTASNPSVSVTHHIFNPLGGEVVSNNFVTNYLPGGVGIFTCVTVNELNGCSTSNTFQINSNQGFPTFTLQSLQNYTLGCSSTSFAVVNILNGQGTNSLQVPIGSPVTYSIIGPPTSSVVPNTSLSISPDYTVTVPGTWTVIVVDNISLCQTRVPISIISNTFSPSLDVLEIPRNILTCETPSVTLNASSLTQSVSYNWAFPGPVGNLPSNSITVNANFTVAATQTVLANYSLTLTDDINKCKTNTVVTIYQNLFTPNALIAKQSATAITCNTPSLTLTNQSTTKIPGGFFTNNLPVVGYVWFGPSPQQSYSNTSTYVALVPGIFTMTARDANNGCEATATISVADDRNFPNVNENDLYPDTLDCGASKNIRAVSVPSTGVKYQWTPPEGGSLSSFTAAVTNVVLPGNYRVLVTNTINGCATATLVSVVANTVITVAFEPDVTFGYAPLTVNFTNNSSTSNGTGSITSVWNFGNSSSITTPSTIITPSTVYNSSGTFTVSLYASKGNCSGLTTRVINVEIPSGLTVPNIFTPNNDGVNDLYFLKVTNLSKIKATIYDRWGTKVYEVDTQNEKNNAGIKDNVNLAWDGKNQYGVELPQGSYFYVIKATGKDGKEYDDKGTITLIR